MSFFTPATGLVRALDIAVNEYQGGQDFMAGWEAHTGQFRPGWPAPVNDLQFLTGPSAANVDAAPGEEIIAGTASLDLAAFNPAGVAAGPGWPKLTSDWMVANPLVGSFGTIDTDSDARNRVVGDHPLGLRARLSHRRTAMPARVVAAVPSRQRELGRLPPRRGLARQADGGQLSGTTVNFTAPGDDLLCGTADHYEIVTSNDPIDGDNFDQADPLADAPQPEAAGSEQSYTLPPGTQAFVAIRAVDDQGNAGRPVVVTTGYPRPKGATPAAGVAGSGLRRMHGAELAARAAAGAPVLRPAGAGVGEPDGRDPGRQRLRGEFGRVRAVCRRPGERLHAGRRGGRQLRAERHRRALRRDQHGVPGRVSAPTTPAACWSRPRCGSPTATTTSAPVAGRTRRTVTDVPLEVPADCTPTAGTQSGATCALTTTLDSVMPGVVKEGDRAIWQMGRVELRDAGPNGTGYGSGCPQNLRGWR